MQDLTRHLKEAIAINTARMPRYGALSKGASIPFSKRLIRYEKMSLLGAWIFDRKGDELQIKGIPYLKAEFVEMSLTPKFSKTYPPELDFTKTLEKVNIHSFSNTVKQQISRRNYSDIVILCQDFLNDLKHQKHVYCMLRHVVESLGRIAYLIPIHQVKCDILNIKSPTNYSHFLLKTHYWVLKQAAQFDEAVAFIQYQGIPFLYQDLPTIEIEGSYD